MTGFTDDLADGLADLHTRGLFKTERVLTGPQGMWVHTGDGPPALNLCANNYLGLAADPRLVDAAKDALDTYGYGMASVRFICGTQRPHRQLETALADYLGTADSILYSSCFDANGGLFEALLGPEDAVISDALNHASLIDGIRLCKARRLVYANNDMDQLAQKLRDAAGARRRLIVTDGVFSMDGVIADLRSICDLAARHDALVMVDDSHATGVVGPRGRGTPALHGVSDRVDILTGTLGKALGGAAGGYVAAGAGIVGWLRQKSRPYLFSNALPPMIAAAATTAVQIAQAADDARDRLAANVRHFRQGLSDLGFTLLGAGHAITPVLIGDAVTARDMADALLTEGVFVIGFSHPVVPMGQARIRTQLSAAHSIADLDHAIAAFARVGHRMGVI